MFSTQLHVVAGEAEAVIAVPIASTSCRDAIAGCEVTRLLLLPSRCTAPGGRGVRRGRGSVPWREPRWEQGPSRQARSGGPLGDAVRACGHRRGIVLIKINLIPEGACPVVRVLRTY